jgi:hypothetical protein
MPKYRRKPGAIIEAEQYVPDRGQWPSGVMNKPGAICGCTLLGGPPGPHVHTAHASQVVLVEPGDWIVPEPNGDGFYPIKADIFEATYEPAD